MLGGIKNTKQMSADSFANVPDSAIAEVISSLFVDMDSKDISCLFQEKAKLTLDTTRKEGKNDIATALKEKAKKLTSNTFEFLKFKSVEIDETSKIYSGVVNWGNEKYMITACIEREGEDNLLLSNLILLKL